jgi:molybdopterin-guanine dinucleotide biosynthesis protein A
VRGIWFDCCVVHSSEAAAPLPLLLAIEARRPSQISLCLIGWALLSLTVPSRSLLPCDMPVAPKDLCSYSITSVQYSTIQFSTVQYSAVQYTFWSPNCGKSLRKSINVRDWQKIALFVFLSLKCSEKERLVQYRKDVMS